MFLEALRVAGATGTREGKSLEVCSLNVATSNCEGSSSGFLESAKTVSMFSNVEDFTNTSDLWSSSYVRTQAYVFFHPFPTAPDTKDKCQSGILRHGIL